MNTAIFFEPMNIRRLWVANFALMILYFAMTVGFPFMKSSVMEYSNVQPLPFDGTISPIAFVPNWLNQANWNKSLRYANIATSEFIRIPIYDPELLAENDVSNKMVALTRGTYITPYMGSYRMNFIEYDGSHVGVDIRSPLGTPVVAIANGVVVKVKNVETSDGKYVVIRHDNIAFNGRIKASYYSSYLHMDNLVAIEGTAVKKGEQIGEVGLTGITTTPHLHIQIDTAEAPFHAFWPYSTTDLRNLGLDFFEAVNVGLGKELGMKYTVHPMEFIRAFQDGVSSSQTTSATIPKLEISAPVVSSLPSTPEAPQTYISAVSISTTKADTASQITTAIPNINLNSAPSIPPVTTESPVVFSSGNTASQAGSAATAFIDIPKKAIYKEAAEFLKARSIPALSRETVFRPSQAMTRREAILSLAGVYGIESQFGAKSSFADVSADDILGGYLETMLAKGYVSSGWIFRPNDSITKVELATLIMRIRGDAFNTKNVVQSFALSMGFPRIRILSVKSISRADAARMIHVGATTTGRG